MTAQYDSIVCLGDSITFGQYLPELAWPRQVEGHDLINAGVSNETTRNGLERFPRDVQQIKPKAVIVQFGHNDCNRWESDLGLPRVSIKAFAANLEEMVVRCRYFGIRPFFCTITPSLKNREHAIDVAVYDTVLREVASRMKVELIDVRAAFEAWGYPYIAESDALTIGDLTIEDGLHLNKLGHRVYAATVQRALDAHWPR